MTSNVYSRNGLPKVAAVALVLGSLSVFSCNEEQPPAEQLGAFSPGQYEQAVLSGTVTDTFGDAVVGATVAVMQAGETLFDTTDGEGRFSREIPWGAYHLTVSGFGYLDHFAAGHAHAGEAVTEDARLLLVEMEDAFLAAEGAVIAHEDATLTLPGGSFVYGDGSPVEGPVDYSLAFLSPADGIEAAAVPGFPFTRSLGVLSAEFEAEGEEVDLAPGATARIEIALPGYVEGSPLPEPFYFDPRHFGWVADGGGSVVATAEGPVWQATVSHFTQWGAFEYVTDGDGNVPVCHLPPGNPENAHTIRIAPAAVRAHLQQHGDYLGPCTDGGDDDGDDGDDDDGVEDDVDWSDEICDGIDNDGDGVVDNPELVCWSGAVCVQLNGLYDCVAH